MLPCIADGSFRIGNRYQGPTVAGFDGIVLARSDDGSQKLSNDADSPLPVVGCMTCPHGRCRGRDGRI